MENGTTKTEMDFRIQLNVQAEITALLAKWTRLTNAEYRIAVNALKAAAEEAACRLENEH